MVHIDRTAAIDPNEGTQIAEGLRQRDVAFVETLVERFQNRLVRYLIYLLGRRDGVDDLVQETWLRVLARGATYDGRSRFEPWLFAIARHLAIDHARRRPAVSLDLNEDEGWSSPPAISSAPSPFALAARSEDARRLADSMEQLGAMYREALVLRFQDDLSLEEISGVVGAPVSTVASRIHRGLAALRLQLEGRK